MSELQNENKLFREKNKELESWLVMLLNSFYQGDPKSLNFLE